ncbi:hypothetical protein Q4F19_20415 [Sphingomonas sp. BIUV-7]|uniref:5-bromo-4-chloroindolyl phosphate hydrolysis protein n=1 Tax=Sphingomonas natans TaxID=3063330 RepID=A0ABT8YG26_9SPHN|nr:hypothetical protein [Sphingomonas sp. BIUV-7]MDO6416760.1 hypothetical protein [Sphingomonas sp. BIUV-7]
MPDPHRVVADAEALLHRVSPEGRALAQRERRKRNAAAFRTGKRLLVATIAVFAAAILWAIAIGPIGMTGFTGALVALIAAWSIILFASRSIEETPERLVQSDLARLPQRTETWLRAQRQLLPPPAARLVDGIGVKLEALGTQLAALDPNEPAANAVRKLLAEELPELIQGYARVPLSLRKARDGIGPDVQLIQGLGVVDEELARMSEDLAAGDLRKLATQNRYLELKYKDEAEG